MEYGLSLPYRLFSQYLIIDKSLNYLVNTYVFYQSSFKKNIVIVGHSLEGVYTKILGKIKGK